MRDFRRKILRRFCRDDRRLSRNRHFHAHLDPKVRNAARTARLLRSLKNDLLNRKLLELRIRPVESRHDEDWVLLELSWDGARRTSYLTRFELSILREDERIDQLVRKVEQFVSYDA